MAKRFFLYLVHVKTRNWYWKTIHWRVMQWPFNFALTAEEKRDCIKEIEKENKGVVVWFTQL